MLTSSIDFITAVVGTLGGVLGGLSHALTGLTGNL